MNQYRFLYIRLKKIVEKTDTLAGRIFDIAIQVTILISIITFSLETLPNLDPELRAHLEIIEYVTVTIFSIEYILRIFVATRKLSFIFSFYGIIDLLAILPFYLAIGVDLRTIRILRFLRIFRFLKLTRYNAAARRFALALSLAREEIIMFLFVSATMMYIGAVGIYYFENEAQPQVFSSVFHSLWWAVITLTTVGYGDIYPITVGGRIFTFIMLLAGVGIISVPAGLIAAALNHARSIEEREKTNKRNRSS